MSITLQVKGEREVLVDLNLDVDAQIDRVIATLLTEGTDVARARTPVVTGAMRSAWRWRQWPLEGMMDIDPATMNPVSGAPVTDYAPIVDDRLGIVDAAFQRMITMPIEEVGW